MSSYDRQTIPSVTTTDATPQFPMQNDIPENCTIRATFRIQGIQRGGAGRAYYEQTAFISRPTGGSASVIGTSTKIVLETAGAVGWDGGAALVDTNGDGLNDAFRINCTGAAATTIDWAVELDGWEFCPVF